MTKVRAAMATDDPLENVRALLVGVLRVLAGSNPRTSS